MPIQSKFKKWSYLTSHGFTDKKLCKNKVHGKKVIFKDLSIVRMRGEICISTSTKL